MIGILVLILLTLAVFAQTEEPKVTLVDIDDVVEDSGDVSPEEMPQETDVDQEPIEIVDEVTAEEDEPQVIVISEPVEAGTETAAEEETPEVGQEESPEVAATEDAGGETEEGEVEKKPSIFVRGFRFARNIAGGIFGRIVGAGRWVVTRDYISAAKNTFVRVWGLPIWVKIILGIVLLIAILIVWNVFFKDSRANNFRRARRLHKKGEIEHLHGNDEAAAYYYEQAAEYREKAQDQW